MIIYIFFRKEDIMGTRGFVGVKVDNTIKGSYNHFDSYPDGLGQDIRFL